jgi:hypothetical protein
MNSRFGYLIMGFLLLCLSGYIFIDAIIAGYIIPFSSSFTPFALSIMFFSLSYLQPQFKKKDERMKLIQQKSMFYSYFILMFYLFTFLWLLHLDIITLTAIALIQILAPLIIMTVFISMVILSKIY